MRPSAAVFGLFLSLALAGPLLSRPATADAPPPFAVTLQKDLHLTDAQMTRLAPVFAQMEKQAEDRETAMVGKVRPILTADQGKVLDRLRAVELKAGAAFKPINFRTDLNLTPDQAAKVKAWRAAERPTINAQHKAINAQIEAVLTLVQKPQFDALLKKHRRPPNGSPRPATPPPAPATPPPAPASPPPAPGQ